MKRRTDSLVTRPVAVLAFACLMAAPSFAQFNVTWQGPNNGEWWTDANWPLISGEGKEPLAEFGEHAIIDNGTTAVVSRPADPGSDPDEGNPGGIELGPTAGTSGGLRIAAGGELTVESRTFSQETTTGFVVVGGSGEGTLTILGNGSLNSIGLTLGGEASSSFTIGDTSGQTAMLSTGSATLGRETRVIGPNVDFNASIGFSLTDNSVLVGEITSGTTHSPLKSPALVSLGGTFRPEFNGVTPSIGDKWDVIDAGAIAGDFSALDTSAVPALGGGQAYRLVRSTGGVNGQRIQLSVDQLLTLVVDRATGTATITNEGSNPISIDGYSITSSFGALTGSWNSLQNQGETGWQEATPSASFLNELNISGDTTISNTSPADLGAPYVPVFPAFGVEPDHLEFEYTTTDSQIVEGLVTYTGAKMTNNLIVTVDPTTGEAVLENDSPFSVSIDAYSIYSDSGSLQPGNGSWQSLTDQGVTGWEEATPSSTVVSELNADGDLPIDGGDTFNFGSLFNVSGTQDLRFQFLLANENTPRDGLVIYGVKSDGDFDGDGDVDGLDFLLWQRNPSVGNLADWQANYGAGSLAANAAAVPEPTSMGLLLMAAVAFSGSGLARDRKIRGAVLYSVVVAFLAAACTSSAQAVVLLDEDFEGLSGLPSGWTLVDNDPRTTDADGNDPTYSNIVGHDGSGGNAGLAGHIGDMIYGIPAPGQPTGGWIQAPASATIDASTSWRLKFDIKFGEPPEGGSDDAVVVFGDLDNRNYYTMVITEANGNNDLFYLANDDRQGQGDGGTAVFGTDGFASDLIEGTWYTGALIWNADTLGLSFSISDPSDQSSRGAFSAALNSTHIVLNTGTSQNEVINPPLSGDVQFGFGTLNDNGTFDNILLETIDIVLGDVDGDGDADEVDFGIIRDNFKQSVISRIDGDLTGDGFVDFKDFRQWKDNRTTISRNSQPVPEPSSICLLLAAVAAMTERRRRCLR